MCKTEMAACALRIKCCVLESCCSFDGSFPNQSTYKTWCQTNTRLKSGGFVHSTVSLCLRTNSGSCTNCSRHFRMLSSWCPYKLFVFAVIMATAPVGFPVPQMQEWLDKREALDCFILDCIDYCTVLWDGSSGKTDVNMTIKARMGKNNGGNKTFACQHFQQFCLRR